ncbi:hypothetical protein D9M72_531450 [compost metagenome]
MDADCRAGIGRADSHGVARNTTIDVLHRQRSQKIKPDGDLVAHLVIDRIRNDDATGGCGSLQARRDIDAITIEVIALGDHVAEIDADAKQHLFVRRAFLVATGQLVLHVDRRAHSFHDARELRDEAIAPGVDDTALMRLDEPSHGIAIALQRGERALLVGTHQSGVVLNIRG